MLQEKIKEEIKKALLARDTIRLETMRGIASACTNELISKGKKPIDSLSDEETLTVLSRLAKQRKDSIEQFKKGNRNDLVLEEEAQLRIIQEYLPQLMGADEIEKIVLEKQKNLNIPAEKKGMLIAEVMKELKGKADGKLVKDIIENLFKNE